MTKLKRFGLVTSLVMLGALAVVSAPAVAQTDKPACAQNAATLVEQKVGQAGVVLKGTTVCALRVVQTANGVERCADGTPIVAVRASVVQPGFNVDSVVTEETYYCSSQLAGK